MSYRITPCRAWNLVGRVGDVKGSAILGRWRLFLRPSILIDEVSLFVPYEICQKLTASNQY